MDYLIDSNILFFCWFIFLGAPTLFQEEVRMDIRGRSFVNMVTVLLSSLYHFPFVKWLCSFSHKVWANFPIVEFCLALRLDLAIGLWWRWHYDYFKSGSQEVLSTSDLILVSYQIYKAQATLLRMRGHMEQRHTILAEPSLISQIQHTQKLVKNVGQSPTGTKRSSQTELFNLWNHELNKWWAF